MAKPAKRKPAKKRRATRVPTTTRGQWQHVVFRLRHTPDYIIKGTDHLELIVLTPSCRWRAKDKTREPLPITETGYLSHFAYDKTIPNAKAALAFFLEWINREAKTKRWQTADNKRRQLDLFPTA